MKKTLLFIAFISLLITYNKGGVMAELKQIQLPPPKTKGTVSLEEAIAKRRSVRNFSAKELGLNEISQLLWAAQGITTRQDGFGLRAAPSAGALYPMELYLISKDGFFHYLPEGHKLEVLGAKDLRKPLANASLGQAAVKDAAIVIVICGVPERVTGKYHERGRRYMYFEAGHIAQNIHLEAVALGLASVPIGAFNDDEVDKILGLAKGCHVLYIIPVGHAY
jgi:SagB-type dehydrogenase family enzyme